uniref:Uncharacterized protein n=1 Tax=Arion vulgaris TaxID=1028688 RepID=A0A0B6ZMA4_9EUPU
MFVQTTSDFLFSGVAEISLLCDRQQFPQRHNIQNLQILKQEVLGHLLYQRKMYGFMVGMSVKGIYH